jgi:hypothetical protein
MEVSGEVHALAGWALDAFERKKNYFYMLEIRLIPRLSSLKHNHYTVMSSCHFVWNTN